MSPLKAAGDKPAKYQDLLSVTSSSFFPFPTLRSAHNNLRRKCCRMAILDGLVVFITLQELYISCYMHEIPLKICITTQVNHKIVGLKISFLQRNFDKSTRLNSHDGWAVCRYIFNVFHSGLKVIFKSSTYIDMSPRERHFWLVTILHPLEANMFDHISFLMLSSKIMNREKRKHVII